jgi:hypothetical protein
MDPADDVNDAITSYSDWSHPWMFCNYVKTRLGRREASQALYDDAWREAIDHRHWQSPDHNANAESAISGIREKFPTISEAALQAIANAASYEWR